VKQEGAQQPQPQHPPPSTSATSPAADPTQTRPPSDGQDNGMAEFGDVSEKDLVDFDDEDDIMDCNN
jgi:hypothetical protein